MHHMSDTPIAFFGTEGSFTYLAARSHFPDSTNFTPCTQFGEVFRRVVDGSATYGVVPIENSLAGSIYDNYDNLAQYDVKIIGETSLRIEHALMVHPDFAGQSPADISEVYSHQKALEQCGVFLDAHPGARRIAYNDTAASAKLIAEKGADTTWAAIAHPDNAALYGLTILQHNIEDNPHNHTRFVVIAKTIAEDAAANKCSLLLTLPHTAGSLSRALTYLAGQDANLTKIESRPQPEKPFEYVFYLDFVSQDAAAITSIIEGLRPLTESLNVLGIYFENNR